MRMLGVHQYENAIAALLGAEAFFGRHTEWICGGTKEREEGVRRAVCQGIAKTVWKGRMEILSKKPFLLVDGAHNSNGVEALRESLVALFPGEKFHFIMGVMADKDYETMIGELLPLAIDFKLARWSASGRCRRTPWRTASGGKELQLHQPMILRPVLREGGSMKHTARLRLVRSISSVRSRRCLRQNSYEKITE